MEGGPHLPAPHPHRAKSWDPRARAVLTGQSFEPYLFSYVAYRVAEEKAVNIANKIQQEQKVLVQGLHPIGSMAPPPMSGYIFPEPLPLEELILQVLLLCPASCASLAVAYK